MNQENTSNIYVEIEQPSDMVPILTKDNTVLWYNVKYLNRNSINNIVENLQKEFDTLFVKAKLYIDTYNFTLFSYNNIYELLKEQSESYDKTYDLNSDLKEKCIEYRNMLDSTLDIVHRIFLEINELISIKHLRE